MTSPRESRLLRMTGRDPLAKHRAATPLELLFDLTFVVAFGIAADQLAHLIAVEHVGAGLLGFSFAMFAICWAWINFTWFASAFDTDDWFYRVTTMVQMIGVIVLALGLPDLFHSLEEGAHVDNRVVVAGYVVMRVALVAQWLRAAKQDPAHRSTALSYALFVSLAQAGWVVVAILDLPTALALTVSLVLFGVEFAGPVLAERKGSGTPWHPHHIAERYGLLTIIALGEVILGTVTSVSALVERQDWSSEAILVVVAGVGIALGLWWVYFLLPSGPLLARHRNRSFGWGYGHIVVFAAIAAVGAGLHVVAYVIEGESQIGVVGAVLAIAIPVAVFTVAALLIYAYLFRQNDPFHLLLFVGTLVVLALAVVLALIGASIGVCLVVLTLAPAVTVVGFETVGYRHQARALERALS
ncbi:low temperature requirement protein A [Salinibacterium soli]|uniref:Low temperature requirement protein A n=1 Tax=Antiquaquibacter soli TaxID=3064523 RepID=A0ABT9BQI4_9MICO|nr:low temperature requirement protein A [Protaetiibacter sp. WY-16]MDO7883264.1 low temperature requirement protein A [Protaetiibacter sp. WY-16]